MPHSASTLSSLLTRLLDGITYWGWWDAHLPDLAQLEFGNVMLAEETSEGLRGAPLLALAFSSPTAVLFRNRDRARVPADWPEQMRAGKMEPFFLDDGEGDDVGLVTFEDAELAADFLTAPADEVAFVGARPTRAAWERAPAKLALWAGPVGVMVLAEAMDPVTTEGRQTEESLRRLHDLWYDYWAAYRRRKGRPDAFPEDFVCEVTIPLVWGRRPPAT